MSEPTLIEDSELEKNARLERRDLLSLSPVALFTAFISACSDDKAKFGGKTGKRDLLAKANPSSTSGDQTNSGGNPNGSNEDFGTDTDAANPEALPKSPGTPAACSPIVTLTNSLSTALDAPSYLVPTLRFYGKAGSALVAIGLPMYTDAAENIKISSITLYDQDSYPISTHIITAADKSASGGIGIFCIDNISLTGTKVHILFSGTDSKNYKVKDIPVSFLDPMAAGKTLVEVSSTSAAFIEGFQGIANFVPSKHRQTTKIVPGTSPRPIYIACKDSEYAPASRLANFAITDMLGGSLGQGTAFNGIHNYQCFIAYRENAGVMYRTIIRMT
jgi:hypothetical protein